MKLSEAQQWILDKAKERIAEARGFETFEDYYKETYRGVEALNTAEKCKAESVEDYNRALKYWNDAKQGITKTIMVNSKTLLALQKKGYIEILELSTGQHVGIDTIKILNY